MTPLERVLAAPGVKARALRAAVLALHRQGRSLADVRTLSWALLGGRLAVLGDGEVIVAIDPAAGPVH